MAIAWRRRKSSPPLLEHDNVAAAVIRTSDDDRGEKRLVAYIVPASRPAPTVSALLRFLEHRLSEHMIPPAFVVLDAMPLLPSGKINRRALPAPGQARPTLDNAYAAARTPTEESLVDIWSEVLRLDQVGIHDHFMELGGDSLRASQVISRALDAFGVDLPVRRLLQAPTVARLAAEIDRREAMASADERERAIRRRETTAPRRLSHGQERLWFLYQLDPDGRAYIMPKVIRLTGELDVAALREALDLIVARHEVLRTNICSTDDGPGAVVVDRVSVDLPVVDLTSEPENRREAALRQRLLEEAARPFELERDLKLRSTLYRLGPEEHVLHAVTHHIASDRWSSAILLRELTAHYDALAVGDPSPLPPLPVQYSDYADWQRDREQDERVCLTARVLEADSRRPASRDGAADRSAPTGLPVIQRRIVPLRSRR